MEIISSSQELELHCVLSTENGDSSTEGDEKPETPNPEDPYPDDDVSY